MKQNLKVGDLVYNDTISTKKRTVFGIVTKVLEPTKNGQDVQIDTWKNNGDVINTTHCQKAWIKYGEINK